MKKVWIVTREYWDNTSVIGVYDSKKKAVQKAKEQLVTNFKVEDLGTQVTVWNPSNESASDYVCNEHDVE